MHESLAGPVGKLLVDPHQCRVSEVVTDQIGRGVGDALSVESCLGIQFEFFVTAITAGSERAH